MPDTPGPSVTQGDVWTVEQWNAFFASLTGKVDAAGGSAANLTISGGSTPGVDLSLGTVLPTGAATPMTLAELAAGSDGNAPSITVGAGTAAAPPGGITVGRATFGNWSTAVVASFVANDPGKRAGFSGFSQPSDVAVYPGIDNGTLYLEMTVPPAGVTAANVTFDTSTVYMASGAPLSPTQIAAVPIGSFVETSHSPSFKGQVTAVASSGASVTVSGWYQVGNTAAGQNPQTVGSGPYTAHLNITTAAWGENLDIFYGPTSYAQYVCGYEMDITNTKEAILTGGIFGAGTDIPEIHGFNTGMSPYGGGSAYIANGNWLRGFVAMGASLNGSDAVHGAAGYVFNPIATGNTTALASSQVAGNIVYAQTGNPGPQTVAISVGGIVELGATSGTATVPALRFHSAANALPDGFIYGLGGTAGVQGAGEIRHVAANHGFYDATNTGGVVIQPSSTGAVSLYTSGPLQLDSAVGIYLATTNGNQIEAADGGAAVTNALVVSGGTASAPAKIAAASSPIAIGTAGTSGGAVIFSGAQSDQTTTRYVATTGGSYTVPNNVSTVLLDPAGTIATFAVTLTAAPIDGQVVEILGGQTITALTVNTNTGQFFRSGSTTLTTTCGQTQGRSWRYVAALAAWLQRF